MKLIIELDDERMATDNLVQVSEEQNGVLSHFHMTVDELRKVINASVEDLQMDTGTLPSNAIRYRETDEGVHVFCEVPKKQWVINFRNDAIRVGFPKMLFHYFCKQNKQTYNVSLKHIWAVKDEPIHNDTKMCHFPYSHVDRDGKVCMGGNRLPDIQSLDQLVTYHSFFVNSPFDTDYGAKTTLRLTLEELYLDTFNEKEFNDDILVPTRETFQETVKSM
ncbi:hypothetical protein ACTWQB_17045 [Piscibacillus sp. B03]|uniref:hypothetical protein n=1 Tax=Piscibacillus sp. B03 TaxID=3457430 RepID=UPI003FCD1239